MHCKSRKLQPIQLKRSFNQKSTMEIGPLCNSAASILLLLLSTNYTYANTIHCTEIFAILTIIIDSTAETLFAFLLLMYLLTKKLIIPIIITVIKCYTILPLLITTFLDTNFFPKIPSLMFKVNNLFFNF